MQKAKDSFYMALRARLATVNARRTILLRGAERPGILVEEAEAPFSPLPSDVFVLRWLGMGAEIDLATTMVAEECEIVYQTSGSQSYGGLDRGRALSAMDAELLSILAPYVTAQVDYSTATPTTLLTRVFWDEPVFGAVAVQRDRLSRAAKVMVYSYEE
jgi:hypothetical protein